MKCITCSGKGKVLTRREGSYRAVRARCDDCYGTGEMLDHDLAPPIFAEVYHGGPCNVGYDDISRWLADPDTERSEDETIESLAADWIEAAHRES